MLFKNVYVGNIGIIVLVLFLAYDVRSLLGITSLDDLLLVLSVGILWKPARLHAFKLAVGSKRPV